MPNVPRPLTREMSVIAQDPSVRANGRILMAKISIPAEDLIAGPIGYRLHVVDYDSSSRAFHGAHDLPGEAIKEPATWQRGDPRIVKDYRFHAQNVYALIMKTLARFEFALGRRIGWSFGRHQLKVAPHGMLDANAFYTPQEEGLVFGYFPGQSGATVYACLSHDVVVHETTHALIDALRARYLDPSSPDQAAFHEGLADVIALLSVFAQDELLEKLLLQQRTVKASPALVDRKDLTPQALRDSALFGLARQMGQEMQGARGDALRHSAQLMPDPHVLEQEEYLEPHRRGEILVAAVMNAFIHAWADRITQLGVPGQRRFPVRRVAEDGEVIAEMLLTMWIRALDYMPPVHLEFPDALSAALTADREVRPDDSRYQLRKHIRDSFASYGIKPTKTSLPAEGTWKPAPENLIYERVRFESLRTDKDEVFRFLWENRKALEVRPGAYTEVLSVRPCTRVGLDGFTVHETVAEYFQMARLTLGELETLKITVPEAYIRALREEQRLARARRARALARGDSLDALERAEHAPFLENDDEATTPVSGGGVLIFDEYGRLKFHVHNDVFGRRQTARLRYLWESGQLEARRGGARMWGARLSAIHRLRAIDARRFPAEGW